MHYLTDRITSRDYDFVSRPRQVEIHVNDGTVLLVGVPALGFPEAFGRAVDRATTALRNTLRGGSS